MQRDAARQAIRLRAELRQRARRVGGRDAPAQFNNGKVRNVGTGGDAQRV